MRQPTSGAPSSHTAPPLPSLRDLLALAKPRITLMSVIMAAGGFALASTPWDSATFFAALLGTALAVSAANTLNMYWERDGDRLMSRTLNRPLPDGRMRPPVALAFGLTLQALSMAVLMLWVNSLTAWLGAIAFALYVFVYTPMKRVSSAALIIGAIPGAMPSLMGWTAATDTLAWTGILYTGILFFWQMPHFLAIAMFRKDEYAKASIKVTPLVHGERATRDQAFVYTIFLVISSIALGLVGGMSWLYMITASALGAWFIWLAIGSLREPVTPTAAWPRRVFVASLLYLPLLTGALVADVMMLR
jgi:heme o synthase